ncbi:MAG: Hsp20/alpha crystallin family protein [Sulfurimonas sp.]|nr:Hsp20/alpha crystallin family protein [Sulfurimonas sp.]MDQ7068286.1 Hsp20/alpha crystallin family protein [Sulfurimonas sp.]
MDLVKSVKEIGSEIEKGVDVIASKVSDGFNNLAAHIPFSNLAKKEDSTFRVEIDFPGVKKEDINVQIEDNILIVSAVRTYQNELTRDDYYICESSFGKIERRFIIPDTIDQEKVDARYKDGRLVLEFEKLEKAKAKKISVK